MRMRRCGRNGWRVSEIGFGMGGIVGLDDEKMASDMVEAARSAGVGLPGIYWRVLCSRSLPGFVVVILWHFNKLWNEFLLPVTTRQKPDLQPITAPLHNLASGQIKKGTMVMAGTLIAALPTLLTYNILARLIMRGPLVGSV